MRYGIKPVEVKNREGKIVGHNWYVVDYADRNKPRVLTGTAFGTADDAVIRAEWHEKMAARWARLGK